MEVLQYIASGLEGMFPRKIFFKWFHLTHSGVSADIIMTYIFLEKKNDIKDNGSNHFHC